MNTFEETKKLIESTLSDLLALKKVDHNALYQAARYSTLSCAKRLRPLIVIELAKSFGAPTHHALKCACAIELIHTYTLIHDDLPCMDDETERRGKPPLHHAFPEGAAVLTGDFLLTYPFEIISSEEILSPAMRVDLIQALSKRIGGEGVIAGQLLDLYGEIKNQDQFKTMVLRKTADLFSACFEFGAIIGKVSQIDRDNLKEFGQVFGLAFQYIDDLEDDNEYSSDYIQDKTTATTIFGIEGLHLEINQLINKMRKIESCFNNELLKFLITFINDKLNSFLLGKPQIQELAAKNLLR
ncbi:MAG: polyprenyl synthetase family protein [Rhabdochlamydiaceae bacterium]|nr:polyprenyl synthetase family protein [Candidatus Amphrikana amoebophyrae]